MDTNEIIRQMRADIESYRNIIAVCGRIGLEETKKKYEQAMHSSFRIIEVLESLEYV